MYPVHFSIQVLIQVFTQKQLIEIITWHDIFDGLYAQLKRFQGTSTDIHFG